MKKKIKRKTYFVGQITTHMNKKDRLSLGEYETSLKYNCME